MMKVLNLNTDVETMSTPIVVNLLGGAGSGKSTIGQDQAKVQ
jgi:adenylylsulfate kinase-like enzyme